jgi:mRNA interferase MazF
LKRGEIWTSAGGEAYAGKPRPVVVLQDDEFAALDSVVVCPFTSNPRPAPFRVPLDPSDANGLRRPSSVMIDKLVSVPRRRLHNQIGRLSTADLNQIRRAVMVFLGFAGTEGS